MDKVGQPLNEIAEFSDDDVARLRDQLSVTTADEFVDLARRFPDSIAEVLGVARRKVGHLRRAAAAVAPEADELAARGGAAADGYPYLTGHDAPPEGHDTFEP
jgi:hypothetical protein